MRRDNLKTGRIKIFTVLILIVALMAAGCSHGGKDNKDNSGDSTISISYYYLDKSTSVLKPEQRTIPGGTVQEQVDCVLSTIKDAPITENYSGVIPKNVEILSSTINDRNLVLNLSKEYGELKAGEELLCRAALVWTLTEIDGIDSVEIKVNGEGLKKTNGEELGPMKREDVVIDTTIETQPTNRVQLKLYFGDKDATKLVAEERTVDVNPNQPLEKYVVEQLIAGPSDNEHIATVPAETKIRDIKTADGICYLDLSAEFVNKHSGGSTGELMTIYSIVNSLCELEHIEKVQFLIEGEKQDEFKGHIEFSKPFSPNYKIEF